MKLSFLSCSIYSILKVLNVAVFHEKYCLGVMSLSEQGTAFLSEIFLCPMHLERHNKTSFIQNGLNFNQAIAFDFLDRSLDKGSVSSSSPCTCCLLVGLCLSPFSWAMKTATTKANQKRTIHARNAGCNRPFNDIILFI